VKRQHLFFILFGAAVLLWGGNRIYRAHANLVTLNVHGMDVRRVISKLEWQTWERIVVNKDVGGTVTLNVRNVPLDEVLSIVGLQTDSRWTRLYPIYSTGKAAVNFKKVVRGDIPMEGSGWTNLQKNPFWFRNNMGGFGNATRAANDIVSAQIINKDLDFTALALSRFSRAQVVPEDNANGNITLKLAQAPFEKAVALVAKQVHRKWDEIYALKSSRSPMVLRKIEDGSTNVGPPGPTGDTSQPKAEMIVKMEQPQKPPEQQMEAFLATMTPEERQKALDQMAMAEQIRALPPEERQQKMQEMSAQFAQTSEADMEQRIQNRLKNGTVDQRIAHDRQQLEKQQRGPKQ
jgi:hypothetical protein